VGSSVLGKREILPLGGVSQLFKIIMQQLLRKGKQIRKSERFNSKTEIH